MPPYAPIRVGERVVVETKKGEQTAVVLAKTTTYTEEDDYKMILTASGAHEPLRRILRRVVERELKYEDDDLPEEEVSHE